MADDKDTIPADPDEEETPIPDSQKAANHPDDTKDVGVGTDEEE